MYLLGLVHGYYPIQEGAHVWHTGISMVVPSTKILDILNQPELVEYERWVAGLMKNKKNTPDAPVEASIEEPTNKSKRKSRDKDVSEHPDKGRFFDDLGKAIRKREKK
jgi:hypothetical protein